MTNPPRAARPGAGSAIAFFAIAWSLIALALATYLMWGYVTEFNSCTDLRIGFLTPVILGLVACLPSFLMLLAVDRMRGPGSDIAMRFLGGAAVASVVLLVGATIAPKPGPPCDVRRVNLRARLSNLATMEENFRGDSNRYSPSLEAIGATSQDYNTSTIRTVIVWADSSSWGAYMEFSYPGHGGRTARWVCGMFSPEDAPARDIEGIGRLANGCWDPARPGRIAPY